MANFREVNSARKILGLTETATLQEIKETYRKLSLRYHPDRCKGKKKKECEQMFKKINEANRIIMAYCAGYKYSFKEKDVKDNTPDLDFEEHIRRFYEDW